MKIIINECQNCGKQTEEAICQNCKTSKYLIGKEKEEENGEITEFVL